MWSRKKYLCEFNQKLNLAPGKYTLSISCTKYSADGEVVPMNRNYDALIFEVMANRPVVGYFELTPKINFREI